MSENLTIWFSIEQATAKSTAILRRCDDDPVSGGLIRLLSPGRYRLAMDPASLAAAIVGAQTGMMQLAVAARLTRMNADQSASIVKLIAAAQQNASSLANVAAGIGTNVNVSA